VIKKNSNTHVMMGFFLLQIFTQIQRKKEKKIDHIFHVVFEKKSLDFKKKLKIML
jgi:hypothetical protein